MREKKSKLLFYICEGFCNQIVYKLLVVAPINVGWGFLLFFHIILLTIRFLLFCKMNRCGTNLQLRSYCDQTFGGLF